MAYKNFEELISSVTNGNSNKKRCVVVCPRGGNVFAAVKKAMEGGAVEFVFTGSLAEIKEACAKYGITLCDGDSAGPVIIDCPDDAAAAKEAVSLVREGKADFIMKGTIETGTLLKEVVNKETGIGLGGTMFHMMLVEIPGYHKIIGVTDGGMIIAPTLEQKVDMASEAVKMFRRIGAPRPKVACLAAVEKVNPKMQETLDAAELKKLADEGRFGECDLEGPISTDLAFSKEAAAIKKYESPVTGDVDIVLVPGIATGNIMVKSLVEFAGAKTAGCILGAKVPIALTSRGASAEEEYNALMLAAAQA